MPNYSNRPDDSLQAATTNWPEPPKLDRMPAAPMPGSDTLPVSRARPSGDQSCYAPRWLARRKVAQSLVLGEKLLCERFPCVTPAWVRRLSLICAGGVYYFKYRDRKFFFLDLHRPFVPCNSQDDLHNRERIGYHKFFIFGGNCLSNGHLHIWRISLWGGNTFCYVNIFDTLHVEQYSFCVLAIRILFCTVVILYIECVFVSRGRFQFYREHWEW
jgi:hypothetical protein